jgi:polar amino acid transport system substrate-binding protein
MMFNKISRFLSFVVVVGLLVGGDSAENRLLAADSELLAVTEPWPPYMGPKLDNQGFLPEVLKASLKRENYPVTVKFWPWARVINGVKTGKAAIILGVYHTQEREDFLLYSQPIMAHQEVLFRKKSDKKITYQVLSDLKPYTIGVVRGTAHAKAFDEATFLKKKAVAKLEQNIEKLMKGRIDLMAGPKDVILVMIREQYPQYVSQIEVLEPVLETKKMYFGFSKKVAEHQRLLDALSNGLESIKQDGTFAGLAKEHGVSIF